MLIPLGMDDLKVALRDTGFIIKYSAASFLVPIITVLLFFEPLKNMAFYALAGIIAFVGGFALTKIFYTETKTDFKHTFLTASLVWLLYPAIAAIPFTLILGIPFIDAFFESVSAITTTGLTVLQPVINSAPASLLFWRSFISWIGGIGIVVMALTGILRNYSKTTKWISAEGNQEHIKPNIKNTVKEIWGIYIGLTLLGIGLLFAAGMNLFSAVNYSMSALSTTGMDLSLTGLTAGHNPAIDWVLILLMFFGAISFSIHYAVLKKRRTDVLFKNAEVKALVFIAVLGALLVAPKFLHFYGSNFIGLKAAFFHMVSSLTGGGFSLASESQVFLWDDFIKLVFLAAMFIGGSAGSTAGGIKLSRFLIFGKSVIWRIKSAILPENSFFSRRFEEQEIGKETVKQVQQFILLYAVFIFVGTLVVTAYGYDIGNALLEVTSAQSNVGIGNGISQAGMPLGIEIMLIFNMWIGRLEIIPVLTSLGLLLSLRGKR